jgi:sulfatase maturation enzyme AslB (radical SAM superfamily)
VDFTGGEPLLEPELLRRAVRHVEKRRGQGELAFVLTTNGTLLTRELVDFLVEHAFRIRLSFDGVAAAQDLRSPGTFAVLDRLLELLQREYPEYLRKSLDVGMTLLPSMIPRLAESVRYFMAKGVPHIGMAPRSTWDPDWNNAGRDELRAQVDRILKLSVRHYRRTGLVPVEFLSGAPVRSFEAPTDEFLCGSVRGLAMVVDPDGRAWACPLLAESLRTLPPLAAEASRVVALGDVRDPALRTRLRRLPSRARALRVFTHKRVKHSSYGRCADCQFVVDCHVCPASICNIPGNEDPDRVPDFVCAFNQVTLAARERFDSMTGGEASAAWYADVRKALHELGEAIKAASRETGSARATGHRSDAGRRPRKATHMPAANTGERR